MTEDFDDTVDWIQRFKNLQQRRTPDLFPSLATLVGKSDHALTSLSRTLEKDLRTNLKGDRRVLNTYKQDDDEYYRQFVKNRPIRFDRQQIKSMREAEPISHDDDSGSDADSYVSETVSLNDYSDDPDDYRELKARATDGMKDVRVVRKQHQSAKNALNKLAAKTVKGGTLTALDKEKLKLREKEAKESTDEAVKTYPKVQKDLKAYKRHPAREIIRRHLAPTSGAAVDDTEGQATQSTAALLKGSSLSLGKDKSLYNSKGRVVPSSLNYEAADRISKVLAKAIRNIDMSTEVGTRTYDILKAHSATINKRLHELSKGAGAGAGAGASSAASPNAAPSRSASRAVSPAPPETEAEDEGGGDGKPKTVKIKRAKSDSAAAEKKVVKVDDKLFMNTVGTAKEIYLSGKKMTTTEELEEVLNIYAGNKSEEALAVIKYIKSKLKRL